jgi:nucleoside phosphorylase
MPPITKQDNRIELARHIIEFGTEEEDLQEQRLAVPEAAMLVDLNLPWTTGLAPTPQELDPEPASNAPLPKADVLVVTWTVAENEALADVLTPGFSRKNWYRYDRKFNEYKPKIRQGAPALKANRLGSYFPTKIGGKSVICFKSELHLNQDGVRTGDGTATLPVKDLFHQMIAEVQPELVITVGTAGATFLDHQLGDVMITRGAKFRLSQEFKNEPFAHTTYKCEKFQIPTKHLEKAHELLKIHEHQLVEPDFGPPTKNYDFPHPLIKAPKNQPDFKIDGVHFDEFHPMLTTDFFEFGNSKNHLELEGCGVEMGDAVLGMVCEELGDAAPHWLVIRNASDPQINGDLQDKPRALNMQAHWAVWYYETYGYWTSVNSAIATWAMIAP